jgi:hypothetical protein
MLCIVTVAHAQTRRKPTSKLYVSDVQGDVQIDNGTEIDDLTKKAVFNAEGTTLETKANSNASVVLSNGTGIYIDANTRMQIKSFEQAAFRPTRTDVEEEPSVSSTDLYLDHGCIGVSTSRLVAGSTMVYETSLASASIRGRQAVVVADDNLTVMSMIQGEATVQAGPLDRPHLVKNHQQIIIRPGPPGQANIVEIEDIPDGQLEEQMKWLEYRVFTADSSRKVVYFEVQARRGGGAADGSDGASGSAGGGGGAGSSSGGDGISLFDGADNSAAPNNQIVAVPVVSANPPVDTNVSPANLTSH